MFLNKDLVSINDFSRQDFNEIIKVAEFFQKALEEKDSKAYRLASEKDLIMGSLFYEDSTRTSTSFNIACTRLGIKVVGFSGTIGTSVMKGETLRHTLDMFEAYKVCGIILRHPCDGSARFAADHLEIPVFNAGDGSHEHPTQTILDLFTMKQYFGTIDGIQIAMVGDLKYGRTVHSLVNALSKYEKVGLHFFSHAELCFPDYLLRKLNISVHIWSSMEEMLPNIDVLYQTRIQKERMSNSLLYQEACDICYFSESMLKLVKPSFRFMHPLPMDKSAMMVFPGMDNHPVSIYKQQAANGVPTRMAEIALSLGLIETSQHPFQNSSQTLLPFQIPNATCRNTKCISRAEYKEGVSLLFKFDEFKNVLCHYCDSLL